MRLDAGATRADVAKLLADLDTASREDSREDTGVSGSSSLGTQGRKERGRSDEIAAVPGSIPPALFDDIELVANL
jgi:hypothetical protein